MPLIVIPAMVMVLFVPTVFVANVAVALAVLSTTESLPWIPTRAADDFCNRPVAAVVRSYTRSLAVMPETVSVFAVISAVVVGWVRV